MRPDWSQLSPESPLVKTYWARWEALSMRNGVLYRRWELDAGDEVTWKLVVPKSLSGEVLGQLHNFPTAGYLGIRKTTDQVRERFSGPDVQELLSDGPGHVMFVRPGRNQTRPHEQNEDIQRGSTNGEDRH